MEKKQKGIWVMFTIEKIERVVYYAGAYFRVKIIALTGGESNGKKTGGLSWT